MQEGGGWSELEKQTKGTVVETGQYCVTWEWTIVIKNTAQDDKYMTECKGKQNIR